MTNCQQNASANNLPVPLPVKPKAVLFDMDNTLYDFRAAKVKACCCVCEYIGLDYNDGPELADYFIFKNLGYENPENIRLFMQDKGVYDEKKYFHACGIYDSQVVLSLVLYPGVSEVLKKIHDRGIKMAIVTDADSHKAEERLHHLGIRDFFGFISGPDLSGKRKPEFDSFALALKKIGAVSEESMIVGDCLWRDIAPCIGRGMITVHAEYGDHYKMKDEKVNPDYTAEDFYFIEKLLDL